MRWGGLLVLAVLPGIPLTQMRIDSILGGFRPQDEVLYLWSGEHIRKLVPGLESLFADLYWLRTVQYFGGQRAYATNKRFDLLRPLIDIATTLDPRLEIGHRYGAIFLSERWPIGAGKPREGIEVLERGCRALPLSWRLRQDLGFLHFLYLKDAKRAAEILLEAAEIPGAGYWLKTLAAQILAKGGERAAARRMWQAMYDQADEGGAIKWNAKTHLEVLDSLDGADALQALVEEFTRRVGRRPASINELRAAGLLRRPPVDPSGVPYDYDPVSGMVKVSQSSSLWRPDY